MRGRRGRRSRILGLRAVLALMAFTLPCPTAAQSTPLLTLTERWSVPWLDTERISRINADGGEGIVVQAGPSVYVVSESLPPEPVGNFQVLDIVGLALTSEGLDLADRQSGRLVRTDMAGRVKGWTAISGVSPADMVSGVLTRCGWVIGLASDDDPEAGSLLVVDSAGNGLGPRVHLPFPPDQMTAAGDLVVISEVDAPYRVALFRCHADDVKVIDTTDTQTDLDLEAWRPLPAFAFGTRILQTWVDTRSDRRRFALYGADGNLLRRTNLSAPLTLVMGTAEGMVIGLRTIPDLEIVVFDVEMKKAGSNGGRSGIG